VVKPDDSLPYPTLWYQYNLHIYREQLAKGASTPSPPYVTAWTRERPPKPGQVAAQRATPEKLTAEQNAYVTRTFFEGLGRTIQTRSEEADGKVLVSGWTEYNVKGKPKTQYLPFFATGFDYVDGQKPPANTGETDIKAELYYDPLEHLTRTVNPNKTYSEVKYQPWRASTYDEEDVVLTSNHYDTPKETVSDAYGRLVQVTEYASNAKKPITTQYGYDLNGNLIEITDPTGKAANKRRIIYDLLGRKLHSYEPNTGKRVYFYDKNGNLIYRRDNKKQWVKYEYDALNRLTKKYYLGDNSPQLVVTNTYHAGKGQNLKGQLAKVDDLSGSMEYSYDARGRVIRKTRQLKGLNKDFITEYQYDSMDRITQVTYPDTKRTVVTYEYDDGNHLKRIPGYLDDITYNAKGQRQSIQYANSVRTEYSYDSQTFLLDTLKTTSKGGTDGDLQHLVYTYDNAGNIIAIEDKSSQASQQKYEYDALYRLTHANSTGAINYDVTYGYDDMGNMIQKSDLASGTFQYDSDGRPHTLDTIHGTDTMSYDDNGNLEAGDDCPVLGF
jgi:YD repeat-containing protein